MKWLLFFMRSIYYCVKLRIGYTTITIINLCMKRCITCYYWLCTMYVLYYVSHNHRELAYVVPCKENTLQIAYKIQNKIQKNAAIIILTNICLHFLCKKTTKIIVPITISKCVDWTGWINWAKHTILHTESHTRMIIIFCRCDVRRGTDGAS